VNAKTRKQLIEWLERAPWWSELPYGYKTRVCEVCGRRFFVEDEGGEDSECASFCGLCWPDAVYSSETEAQNVYSKDE